MGHKKYGERAGAALNGGALNGGALNGEWNDGQKTHLVGVSVRDRNRVLTSCRGRRLVFVSGTTGFNYASMTISDDVVAQCEQTMSNIDVALKQAGASMADIVRVHYILPRREDFEKCWPILRKHLANVRPAATMIHAGLSDPRMLIEIEVTARRADR
jgi:enamine deaminase RidA (YjgF/YER057c/UK114 family)